MEPDRPLQREPFTEPLLGLTDFRLLSVVHNTAAGEQEPAALLTLYLADESKSPPQRVKTHVRISQGLFDSLARKAAQMAGMTQQVAEELRRLGHDKPYRPSAEPAALDQPPPVAIALPQTRTRKKPRKRR